MSAAGRDARPGRAPLTVLAALVALTSASACGGSKIRGQAKSVDALISSAHAHGAVRCAPVELALAESHVDFARQELDEGRMYQARRAISIAEKNAKEAIRRSPKILCSGQQVAESEPAAPVAAVKRDGDRDGDNIRDSADDCPDEPEDIDAFQDGDGCPDKDNDADGLADNIDNCPNNAEDKDNFRDDDGCPDPDNDRDNLADTIDQCPDQPEDDDGFEQDDGCPDCDNDGDGVPECPEAIDKCPDKPAKTADGCPQKYKLIVVTEDKIELKQTIFFATRKARIKRRSYPLLNEVAAVLKDNPNIRVRIEGHTDSRGSDRFNLRLSRSRAKAVRRYLIGRGVEPYRLKSEGFGETAPIADNR
ncbi:MAG: OmpA family protein, partial [Myxococcota bacterium]